MPDSSIVDAEALANPILNGPYDPPERHFVLGPDGPTGETRPGRRASESFIPIPQERKGRRSADVAQQALNFDLTGERREANDTINGLRRDVESVDVIRDRIVETRLARLGEHAAHARNAHRDARTAPEAVRGQERDHLDASPRLGW